MPTDDERRRAASRLREVQADVIPGTNTEVHPIAGRIIGVACGYDLPDFQGLLGRLADLIEPSCDRDALLAMADELEEDACWEVQTPGDTSGAWRLKDACDRIREALGVRDG